MIVETYEKVIPAKIVTINVYVASDGKKFRGEASCLLYEKSLMFRDHKFLSAAQHIYSWPDEESATMYKITSDEDYSILKMFLNIKDECIIEDDYPTLGPGFYLLISHNNGDHPDTFSFCQVEYLLHRLQLELQTYVDTMRSTEIQLMNSLCDEESK